MRLRGRNLRAQSRQIAALLLLALAPTDAAAQGSAVVVNRGLLEGPPAAPAGEAAPATLATPPERLPQSRIVLPPEAAGLAASLASRAPSAPPVRRAAPLASLGAEAAAETPPPAAAAPEPGAAAAPPPPPTMARATPPETAAPAAAPAEAGPLESSPPPAAQPPAVPPPPAESVLGPRPSLRLTFAAGEAGLSAEQRAEIAAFAPSAAGKRLELTAYASGRESDARRLSLARAQAVRSALVEAGLEESEIRLRPLGNAPAGAPGEAVEILLEP